VPGEAQSSGSKRGFYNKKLGRVLMVPASKKQKPWQDMVKFVAMNEFAKRIPFDGPLDMSLVFVRMRPKGHYGTGRNEGVLKDWAKDLKPTGKPDSLKLGRAVEDALKGIIYGDDAQIVHHDITKLYGPKPGVDVCVRQLSTRRKEPVQWAGKRRNKNNWT